MVAEKVASTLIDIISAFFLDTIKSKLKHASDSVKIKAALDAYLKRKLHENKLCTFEEEIDLEGLIKYIKGDCLLEVQSLFFGSAEGRNRARQEILNHTHLYAQTRKKIAANRAERIMSDVLNILREFCRSEIPNEYKFLVGEAVDDIKGHVTDTSNHVTAMIQEEFQELRQDLKKQNSLGIYAIKPNENIGDTYGMYLLAESNNTCPYDGCSRSLCVNEDDGIKMIYDIVVIDPTLSQNNIENLIAMCPSCAARYTASRTPQQLQRIKAIKEHLIEKSQSSNITSEEFVQAEIRQVLERFPKYQLTDNINLNYVPVPVKQKILKENVILFSQVQGHVNRFYPAVDAAFRELEAEKIIRFDKFCRQVHSNYLSLKENGYDQDQIFDAMVEWLCRATNGKRSLCEIVISYFIQKCEVFDAIAE